MRPWRISTLSLTKDIHKGLKKAFWSTFIYDTIPSTVYGKEDLVIYVGSKVARAYQSALSGVTNVV